MQHGSVTNEQLFEFLRGTLQAKFLFGDEVTNYLDKTMYASLGELQLAATMMETADEDRGKWIDKKYAALRTVANFYQETARLIRPYMSMHAKTPW